MIKEQEKGKEKEVNEILNTNGRIELSINRNGDMLFSSRKRSDLEALKDLMKGDKNAASLKINKELDMVFESVSKLYLLEYSLK